MISFCLFAFPFVHLSIGLTFCLSKNPCIYLSKNPCIYLSKNPVSIYQRIHVSIYQRIHVSIYQRIHVSIYQRIHVSIYQRIHVSIYQRIHVSIYQRIHVSIYQRIHVLKRVNHLRISKLLIFLSLSQNSDTKHFYHGRSTDVVFRLVRLNFVLQLFTEVLFPQS